MVPSWSRPVIVKALHLKPNIWTTTFTQNRQKQTWTVIKIKSNSFMEAVIVSIHDSVSIHSVSSSILHFPIICCSCMKIFACCYSKTMSRVRKRLYMCALWPRRGKTDCISRDKRVCVFSSVKSGPRRPPPHWACDSPRGPDPAFPVFLCLCREFSTDFSAQLHDLILPPSSLSPLLLYLPDSSLQTLASPQSVSLGAPSLPQISQYESRCIKWWCLGWNAALDEQILLKM